MLQENETSNLAFDTGVTKVIILASALIIFSMLLIGTIVYKLSENEVVRKLKNEDLITIAELISTKVDARIDKAIETSLTMANDPTLQMWLESHEEDELLTQILFEKTTYLHEELDYSTTFIASVATRHYYNLSGDVINVLSENDPNDIWFFNALSSNQAVDVNFDYNVQLRDTFAFVNALVGLTSSPVAVVGVGMNLNELSADFAAFKEGEAVRLWLIDENGSIYLASEFEHYGLNIREVVAESAQQQLFKSVVNDIEVIEYRDDMGKLMDLISYPLDSTDLTLFVEIDRDATVYFLSTIRWNTILAVSISILSIIFFFFYISRKLANPYKRAIALNKELEFQVDLRTKELSARNEEMMDSIDYAKRLQESVLPSEDQLKAQLEDYFVIWKPRDIVGGDFYWLKQVEHTTLAAIGDCTGHGVPGAFMTMLAISALNRITDIEAVDDPAAILSSLNRQLKETLHQKDKKGLTDDGLDLGLCSIEKNRVVFSGAGISLYTSNKKDLHIWKGDRKKIGYRRTPLDYEFTNYTLPREEAVYYMTTDGYYDQNGGEKDYSFSKSRFAELIKRVCHLPFTEQKAQFLYELECYMGKEKQRDDITMLSFLTKLD